MSMFVYLEIAVENTFWVAVEDSAGNLAEYWLDGHIVAYKATALRDGVEQIALDPTVEHHVEAVVLLNDFV